MKRKSLFGLALLLFLSTVAFSNERGRYHCRAAGSLQAASEESAGNSSTHVLLHTFIKLLYI
jgi:hypothetical protein